MKRPLIIKEAIVKDIADIEDEISTNPQYTKSQAIKDYKTHAFDNIEQGRLPAVLLGAGIGALSSLIGPKSLMKTMRHVGAGGLSGGAAKVLSEIDDLKAKAFPSVLQRDAEKYVNSLIKYYRAPRI